MICTVYKTKSFINLSHLSYLLSRFLFLDYTEIQWKQFNHKHLCFSIYWELYWNWLLLGVSFSQMNSNQSHLRSTFCTIYTYSKLVYFMFFTVNCKHHFLNHTWIYTLHAYMLWAQIQWQLALFKPNTQFRCDKTLIFIDFVVSNLEEEKKSFLSKCFDWKFVCKNIQKPEFIQYVFVEWVGVHKAWIYVCIKFP